MRRSCHLGDRTAGGGIRGMRGVEKHLRQANLPMLRHRALDVPDRDVPTMHAQNVMQHFVHRFEPNLADEKVSIRDRLIKCSLKLAHVGMICCARNSTIFGMRRALISVSLGVRCNAVLHHRYQPAAVRCPPLLP